MRHAERSSPPSKDAPLSGLLRAERDSAAKGAADSVRSDSAKTDSTAQLATGGPISRLMMGGQMPGQFLFERTHYEALRSFLQDSAVLAVIPPGKVLRFGNDSTVVANKTYRFLYMLDERPIITGEYLIDAKPNQTPTRHGS